MDEVECPCQQSCPAGPALDLPARSPWEAARTHDGHAIRAQAKNTVEKQFAEELARGEIAWKVLDFEAPENAPFASSLNSSQGVEARSPSLDSRPGQRQLQPIR